MPHVSPDNTCLVANCQDVVVARGLCRPHYLRAWRAGTLDELPRRRREPHRCPDDHPHDLETCWTIHGCRCETCVHLRKLERQRRRNSLIAQGRRDEIGEPRVPVAPVIAHVDALRKLAGLDHIADAAGLTRAAAMNAYYGPRGQDRAAGVERMISASLAGALLAVNPEDLRATVVDGVGTSRRLQALVAIGYSQSAIAAQLGMHVGNLAPLLHGRRKRILRSTAKSVSALFDRLWMHPVESREGERPRALAKAHRWVSPLAWDDIDDPSEAPYRPTRRRASRPGRDEDVDDTAEPSYVDEIAVERALTGEKVKLTYQERLYAVTRLHRRRWSDKRIARTLHVDERTILRNRQTLGLPAWELHEMREAESA